MKGYVHSIETMGTLDGPGIRTVIFLQGCPSRCIYCHNPDTWKVNTGRPYEPKQIVDFVKRYIKYYGEEGGVTFSGGEPLLQGKFLIESIKTLKGIGINSIIDTSGTYVDEYTEEVIENCQLIILDIKHSKPQMFQKITGLKQDTLLRLIEIINRREKKVWLRQVIVPGINDSEENINHLNEFIKKIEHIEKVELLGYHSMGKTKWDKLGIEYQLTGTENMDKDRLKELNSLIKLE